MKDNCKIDLQIDDKCGKAKCCAMTRKLSEAIIAQALEDLWVKKYRESSIDFFSGRDFHVCAEPAGLNFNDKIKLLDMVWGILKQNTEIEVEIREPLPGKSGQKPLLHVSPH